MKVAEIRGGSRSETLKSKKTLTKASHFNKQREYDIAKKERCTSISHSARGIG